MGISVTIVAKNASATLPEVLGALAGFDEVILLDNLSKDDTAKIAASFPNVRVFQSPFLGFGRMKNLAISHAKNDWIFSLDSDEVPLDSLLAEIFALDLSDPAKIYSLRRQNLYKKRWIKACGWHPDFVNRIFNKTHTQFNDNEVHESLILRPDSRLVRLNGALKHYAYDSISQLIYKMNLYSTLAANASKKPTTRSAALTHALWSFFRSYFLQRGFLFGFDGFLISYCNALGTLFKYLKIHEKHSSPPTTSLIITTYNNPAYLALVLESALAQSTPPNEILIADDGSTHETRDLVESFGARFRARGVALRHIWQEDAGFRLAGIRNRAIAAANFDYIIIIDGDMVLSPDFVKDHLRAAREGILLQGSRVIVNQKTTNELLNLNYENAAMNGGGAVSGEGGENGARFDPSGAASGGKNGGGAENAARFNKHKNANGGGALP